MGYQKLCELVAQTFLLNFSSPLLPLLPNNTSFSHLPMFPLLICVRVTWLPPPPLTSSQWRWRWWRTAPQSSRVSCYRPGAWRDTVKTQRSEGMSLTFKGCCLMEIHVCSVRTETSELCHPCSIWCSVDVLVCTAVFHWTREYLDHLINEQEHRLTCCTL